MAAKGSPSVSQLFGKSFEYPPVPRGRAAPAKARALAAPKADLNLEVPHIHQLWDTPDAFDGHWACGPTSSTMVLAFYGLLQPHPFKAGSNPYGWYVSNPFARNGYGFEATAQSPRGLVPGIYGTALDNHGSPAKPFWVTGPYKTHHAFSPRGRGIQSVMEVFGVAMKIRTPQQGRYFKAREFADLVIANLKRGHPVIMGGDVNGYGHIIVVRGYGRDATGEVRYVVNDPFGPNTSGRKGGGNLVYGFKQMNPRWMCLFGAVKQGRSKGSAASKTASRGLVETLLDNVLELAFNFLMQKFGSDIPGAALSIIRPILGEFMQGMDQGQVRIPVAVRLELQARLDDGLRQAGLIGR